MSLKIQIILQQHTQEENEKEDQIIQLFSKNRNLKISLFSNFILNLAQKYPLRNGKIPQGFSKASFYQNLEERISDEIYKIENENGYKLKFSTKMQELKRKKRKIELKAK